MYLFFLTVLMWSLQRWVASEAEADLSHRRSALQTQQGAVQHEEGDAGAQQGELSFYNCIFKTVKSKNKRDVRKRSPLIFLNRSLLIGMQTHADHTRNEDVIKRRKSNPFWKKEGFRRCNVKSYFILNVQIFSDKIKLILTYVLFTRLPQFYSSFNFYFNLTFLNVGTEFLAVL